MFPWFCLSATLLIYAQSLLGAFIRHNGEALALHVVMALVVAVQTGLLVLRTLQLSKDMPVFRTPSICLGLFLVLQLALGVGSYAVRSLSFGADWHLSLLVAVTTAHVVVGALLLAMSVVVTSWAFRLLSPPRLPVVDPAVPERSAA